MATAGKLRWKKFSREPSLESYRELDDRPYTGKAVSRMKGAWPGSFPNFGRKKRNEMINNSAVINAQFFWRNWCYFTLRVVISGLNHIGYAACWPQPNRFQPCNNCIPRSYSTCRSSPRSPKVVRIYWTMNDLAEFCSTQVNSVFCHM